MMMRTIVRTARTAALPLLGLALAAAGCTAAPPAPVAGKAKIPVTVEAAPVKTEVGAAASLEVTITARAALDAVTVEFVPGRGIELLDGSGARSYGPMGAGQSVTETLRVSPSVAGLAYVNAFVRATAAGREAGAAYSLAVQSGDDPAAGMEKSGELKTDAGGGRILEMRGRTE